MLIEMCSYAVKFFESYVLDFYDHKKAPLNRDFEKFHRRFLRKSGKKFAHALKWKISRIEPPPQLVENAFSFNVRLDFLEPVVFFSSEHHTPHTDTEKHLRYKKRPLF